MLAATQDFYRVDFQAAPALLRGLVLRPLNTLEFTQVAELLLAEAQRHTCPYWLLDGRADVSREQPGLYHWLEDDYLPRVRRTLGRMPIVALLAQPALWQQLQAKGHIAEPTVLFGAYRLGWFTEEAAAQTWIDQFRTAAGEPQKPAF